MSIMIASGRYKKLRINESNSRYQEKSKLASEPHNVSILTKNNSREHLRRIKSQIMTENVNREEVINKLS